MAVSEAVEVLPILKKISKTKTKAKRNLILNKCPCKVFKVLSEIARNILNGSIKVPPRSMKILRLYKNELRRLAKQTNTIKIKKELTQKGGAVFLPLLLKPALSLLASIVASKIIKR